jgi:aminoglycoside 2''-phosphotransferase
MPEHNPKTRPPANGSIPAISAQAAQHRFLMPDTSEFIQACCRTVGLSRVDVQVDSSGRRNLVILHAASTSVYRFPREISDAKTLAQSAIRHRAAADLGLPVPRLLSYRPGSPSVAHMHTEWIDGIGLDHPVIQGLGARQPERIGRQLAGLLRKLRDIAPERWPTPGLQLSDIFSDLISRLAELQGRVPDEFFHSAIAAAEIALAASADARYGLVHGDLGGVNTRFDEQGRLVGVLDWDGAGPGDVAADVTAIAEGIPNPARQALIASFPGFAADIARCGRYVDTWAGQGALWAIEVGDEEALADVVAREAARVERPMAD